MVQTALIVGALDMVLCVSAGLFVLASAPGRRQNRALAAFLLFEGAMTLGAGVGMLPVDMRGRDVAGFAGIFAFAISALPALALGVVRELPTPLTRPLRLRGAGWALAAITLYLVWWNLDRPPFPVENDRTRFTYDLWFGVSLFSLAASLDAWWRAPPRTDARRQARLFAMAFGVRDASILIFAITGIGEEHGLYLFDTPLMFWGTLLFVPLLAYGILRGQVLGIELVVKRSAKRGLVLAAFVLAFVVASETVERIFAVQYGPMAGVVAAGVLAIAVRPLDRGAERILDRLMPEVRDTESYRAGRRLELYRAAVESAHGSGGISDKERESLERLRAKLDIENAEAERVERGVIEPA